MNFPFRRELATQRSNQVALGAVPFFGASATNPGAKAELKRGKGSIAWNQRTRRRAFTERVQGARSVILHAANKTDSKSKWVTEKVRTRGHNKACVAVANKNARVIWAILSQGERKKLAPPIRRRSR